MLTKWILGTEQKIKSASVIWNTLGGLMSAGQSAIILIFISHKLGLTMAGIFTIAYAIAQIFLSIAKYGVRNFQVTDVNEKFSFQDYFRSRMLSLILACVIFLVYMLYEIQTNDDYLIKGMVILEVVLLKLIDSVEDVYLGRFQQIGRLDIGAKIMAVRLIVSTALICICVLVGIGILIAVIVGILFSILFDIFCLRNTFSFAGNSGKDHAWSTVGNLMKNCFPLCIGTTLAIYIGNAPKYMINMYMDEVTQAIFGYIMMPVFIITLLNQFIYQPVIKYLGDLWEQGEVTAFRKRVLRQCLIVAGLIVLALILGMTIGLPVLSFIYGTDLRGYRPEFAVLLIGGGFYALAYYLNVPLTTIRKQTSLAIGYLVAAVVAFVSGKWFVERYGIMGASILYMVITALLAMIFFVVLMFGIHKGNLAAVTINNWKQEKDIDNT